MAIHRTVRRLSRREYQQGLEELRRRQLQRDHRRTELRLVRQRHLERRQRLQAALVLGAVIAFFALVAWLAISHSPPPAF